MRGGSAAAQVLGRLTDFVVVIDSSGSIVYVNAFALRLLRVAEEDLIGTSILDWLHPDDLERALIGLGHAAEPHSEVPVTPAFHRIRRSDGSWCRIEVNATRMDDEDGSPLLLALGRFSGDHELQDRVMDLLVSDASTAEAIALVPEFGYWRHEGVDYAVFYLDDIGQAASVGSEVLVGLGGLEGEDTPWNKVARTGTELTASIGELLPTYALRADEVGVAEVCGVPVADPLHDSHAVVAYARRDHSGAAPEVHAYALAVMAKALRLILQWRYQVVALRRAARRDPLTGLANRTALWELLEDAELGGRCDGLGVLYVDLDGFKAVNDQHGHGVGDLVLAEVAERLSAAVRPDDVVARLGGDEFAIVGFDLRNAAAAIAIADRVVEILARPFVVGGATHQLGASVGIAIATGQRSDPDELIDRADAALYRAKHGGRGRWFFAGS